MRPRKFTTEKIIIKLREAEVLISQGMDVYEASRQIGVSRQTFYRWRKEYGGMRVDQARRLKLLQKENLRLKHIVADKELDIQILKETLSLESKNF
ncbi:MAG: transposase [Candidatus Marinimicrobia bacterium]|nr:transposase [Candidatus Neomarinimicrobiota bacterium]